ncbi:MAG: hypothetical protein ACRYG8_16055 [Janthinobacterium lividum]
MLRSAHRKVPSVIGQARMRVEVDEGSPTATLTVEYPGSDAVSYVTMSAHQLRPLVVTLAQALNRLDSQAAGEAELVDFGDGVVVSPVHRPDWRVARLGTGDPAILVELWGRLWIGFSLSAREARRLATRLLVAAESDDPGAG